MPLIAILGSRSGNRTRLVSLARSIAATAKSMWFADPVEALDWLERHAVDLVVADYEMPTLDGAAFILRLRALPQQQDVPVMMITARGDSNRPLLALEAGATDFLRRPVDSAEFVARSRNLLRLHERNRLVQARTLGLEAALADSVLSREKLVRDNLHALAQMIDTVPAFISAADPDGRTVLVNAMHSMDQGQPAYAAMPALRAPAPVFDEDYQCRSRALDQLVFRSGQPLPAFEQEVADQAGGRRVLLTTKSPLRDGSGAVGSVLTTSLDITGRKQLERHLRHVASHDGLTDLPNRRMLQERLSVVLGRTGRNGRMVALHFIDLDRFKVINDRYGHQAGDKLLRTTAARLLACVGPGDAVARIGGDEFAVLQGSASSREEAESMAERILAAISHPHPLAEQEISVGASIGISLSCVETMGAAEMLRHADLAMYQAKHDGRNRLRFFKPDMDQRIERALRLQHELRRALVGDELTLHYQPQMNLRSTRLQGVEALVRWNHPGRGLMMPGEFLPVAEQAGMMGEIDEWVLRRACLDAISWRGAGFTDVRVAVNISPVRVAQHRTRSAILAALSESGLDPSLLEIELTEGELVSDLEGAADVLAELRSLGIQTAIDDFGIGYSFFGHMKAFPVDRIKIDQSFVRGLLDEGGGDAAIIRAVVAMAHGLNLGVVAEGVETMEQLTRLAVEGCDEIQGYFISRPLPLPDLLARLAEDRKRQLLAVQSGPATRRPVTSPDPGIEPPIVVPSA